jgi:hypothetical protein
MWSVLQGTMAVPEPRLVLGRPSSQMVDPRVYNVGLVYPRGCPVWLNWLRELTLPCLGVAIDEDDHFGSRAWYLESKHTGVVNTETE